MDFTQEQLTYNLHKHHIPIYMHNGIINWIINGIRPGNFLCAVFENDLKGSFMSADDGNIYRLHAYVNFLYSAAPDSCWGSKEKVAQWEKDGGLRKERSIKSLDAFELDDGE
jgi:hypothetical protein